MRFIQNPFLVALLAFILFISGLRAIGFVGPDEARYADVARGMLLSGDYVTPRLFGEPWFEKPPLYYWAASQLFRISMNEQTARLPSAIAAIVFLLVWFRFARARFGETVALLATIFLASSLGWIGFARAAAMDMLFAATIDLALLLLALWLWERKPLRLYGFYIFLGLATLAKGPLAVVLAGLVFLGYVATFRDWAALRTLLLSPALAVFFAVAGPWYALCYAVNGAPFVEEFILEHNLARLVSAAALGHGQPAWFYIPVLIAGLFPWSPLLLLPLGEMVHAARGIFFGMMEQMKQFNKPLDDYIGIYNSPVWPNDGIQLPTELGEAIYSSKRMFIRYVNGEGIETERWITPKQVMGLSDYIYLQAHCHLRNGERNFRLDRILEVKIEGEHIRLHRK